MNNLFIFDKISLNNGVHYKKLLKSNEIPNLSHPIPLVANGWHQPMWHRNQQFSLR